MTTIRRARRGAGRGLLLGLGGLLLAVLVVGFWHLQSMRGELRAARASLTAAQASVDTVTGRLQDVRNALAAARAQIDALDQSIGVLDRQTARRSGDLDARIRVLRTRVQHADRQLMQQIHRLATDSLPPPVYRPSSPSATPTPAASSAPSATGRFPTPDSSSSTNR